MREAPDGPYVYQPYGSASHPEHARLGRLWAIGGLPWPTEIKGLTRDEAERILAVLRRSTTDEPTGGEDG